MYSLPPQTPFLYVTLKQWKVSEKPAGNQQNLTTITGSNEKTTKSWVWYRPVYPTFGQQNSVLAPNPIYRILQFPDYHSSTNACRHLWAACNGHVPTDLYDVRFVFFPYGGFRRDGNRSELLFSDVECYHSVLHDDKARIVFR